MRTMQVALPDKLADQIDSMVETGWFRDSDQLVQLALIEFLRHNRQELAERFQMEDVEWALKQKPARA